MKRFEAIKFERKTTLKKEGMEICSYIAGVNSGAYGLPFVISIRCWARKWWFKKFFYRAMKLSVFEVKQLKEELDKVIELYENRTKTKYK